MPPTAAVPVLAYHSMKVSGAGHADNDHVAFAEDLERIHALGLRIVPAGEVARACVEGRLEDLRGSRPSPMQYCNRSQVPTTCHRPDTVCLPN